MDLLHFAPYLLLEVGAVEGDEGREDTAFNDKGDFGRVVGVLKISEGES